MFESVCNSNKKVNTLKQKATFVKWFIPWVSCGECFASVSGVSPVLSTFLVKMSSNKGKNSATKKIQTPRNSQDDTSQCSQKSKSRAKNYSAEECEALIKCCEKFHSVITLNSSRDTDKTEKKAAWKLIKRDFNEYCKSQGIYVSKKLIVCYFFLN